MKRVKWPVPETIDGVLATPLVAMQTLVLCREYARDRARVSLALDVEDKLASDPIPDLTDEECEFLCSGLVLQNERIAPPGFNRYALRCLRALHQAEKVEAGN